MAIPNNVGKTERALSIAGGSALLMDAMIRKKKYAPLELIAAGLLLFRGSTGYCPAYDVAGKKEESVKNINIRVSVIVFKSRQKVYNFWRNLSNLPYFMDHLEYVQVLDENRSRWKVKGPAGLHLTWNAYIVKDIPGELLGWSSLPGSDVETSGKVEFLDAGKYATEVRINISYRPSSGISGKLAKLFNGKFRRLVKRDIQNFKNYIETGNH